MTIEIFDSFTVPPDLLFDFFDEGAAILRGPGHAGDPVLINQGSMRVFSAVDGRSIDAITTAPGERGNSSAVHFETGSQLVVKLWGADSGARGVVLDFTANSFANEGSVYVIAKGDATGVASSHALEMTNSGGMRVASHGTAIGVDAQGHASIGSSGAIRVYGGVAVGISLASGDVANDGVLGVGSKVGDATGLFIGEAGHLIENGGLIHVQAPDVTGASSYGVVLADGPGVYHIDNSGIIHAHYAIFQQGVADGPAAQVLLDNTGVISGEIRLLGADDAIINDQGIGGDAWLGGGDDLYDGSAGRLRGTIHGEAGADVLTGGHGVEVFDGGAGADILTGGRGQDQLTGGADADVFVFTATSDSRAGAGDLITDLEATDRIDLSAVDADRTQDGDQDFTLVDHFTGHAGELKLVYHAGADMTLLDADTNGDGIADLEIRIAGDHADFAGLLL